VRRHPKVAPAGSIKRADVPAARARVAVALLAALVVLLLGVPAAQAETAYVSQGGFGYGTLGDVPTDVAIEDATGHVFVTDSENDRVVVFESAQPGAAVLTTFGSGELSDPAGIAVDQGSGNVYVADAGNNRIVRYTSDGTPTPTFTLDGTYTSPAQGSGAEEVGSFASPLAIDPTSGDLLVADTGNLRVERFDSSGAFLDSFDGADSETGAFTSLLDIATGPDGTIYLVANGFFEAASGFVSGSVVETFAPDGSFEESLAASDVSNVRSVAYEPLREDVLVATSGYVYDGPLTLKAIHDGVVTSSVEIQRFEEKSSLGAGIAVPGTGTGPAAILTTLAVENGNGAGGVQSLARANIQVTGVIITDVTSTSAHLSGTVDTNGAEGSAHFEYRRVGVSEWSTISDQPLAAVDGPQTVEVNLSGLLPTVSYEVRLSATSPPGFVIETAIGQLEAMPAPPTVETEPAVELSTSGATLRGVVNPEGLETTYYFEYGPTAAYGSQAPLAPASAGESWTPRPVHRSISGLTAGGTYHYRIVAENSVGQSFGADQTFTTPAVAPPGRAYEQVSPVEKIGGTVDGKFTMIPQPDGEGISYIVRGTGDQDINTSVVHPIFHSRRGSSDWEPWVPVDPPLTVHGTLVFMTTLAVSRDGTHALVASNKILTPDAQGEGPGIVHLYRRDLAADQYELVASADANGGFVESALWWFTTLNHPNVFLGGSKDLSIVYFNSSNPLLPEAQGLGEQIYRWSKGDGLELSSVLPNGVPAPDTSFNNAAFNESGAGFRRFASADGQRFYFGVLDQGVYMREGDTTMPISISEVDGTVKRASYAGTDAAGKYGFFVTSEQILNEATPECGLCLYRKDTETGEVQLLSPIGQVNGLSPGEQVVGIVPDGSTVYFRGPTGAVEVWHEGTVSLIRASAQVGSMLVPSISPNGRYMAVRLIRFGANDRVPGDIYFYDVKTNETTCVSCLDGEPTDKALLPNELYKINNAHAEVVTDEGQVFFSTSSALLPRDTNGAPDVYEYADGQLTLISPGNAPVPAYIGGVGGNGRDVFFVTSQGLVPQDTDGQPDLYDARVGGGFASQQLTPRTQCAGEACQPAVAPPTTATAASEAASPVTAKKHKKKKCKAAGKKPGKRAAKCSHHKKKKGSKAKRNAGRAR